MRRLFPLVLALVLPACKPLDGPCWDERVVFTATDGTESLLTGDFLGGTSSDPADIQVDRDGTLEICAGSYFATVTVGGSAQTVTITGPDGPAATTLNGGGQRPVLDATVDGLDLAVDGLTLTGGAGLPIPDAGSSSSAGGGLRCVGPATLSVGDLVVEANTAHHGSGIALIDQCSAVLSSVAIVHNTSSGRGALYVQGSDVTVEGSLVDGNQDDAGSGGGGIAAEDGVLRILDSTIIDNYNASSGGGIRLDASTLALDDTLLETNASAMSGGGLWAGTASQVTIDHSTFIANSTLGDGGAIHGGDASVLLTGSALTSNKASIPGARGGAIYGRRLELMIEDCQLTSNQVADAGGAMALEENSVASVALSELISNTSGASGGAIHLESSDLDLSGSLLESNTATIYGGGLWGDDSRLGLDAVEIIGNQATLGGGVALMNSELAARETWFEGNLASHIGGGLNLEGDSTAELTGCGFWANTANTYGGGIAVDKTSQAAGEKCTFQGNLPDDLYKDGAGPQVLKNQPSFSF